MAVVAQGSGTQTATLTTEHTLLDVAIAGTFTLHVDTNALTGAETLELRIYQIVLTGGTRRLAYTSGQYVGVQLDPVKISVPISNELTDAGSIRFTLTQTGGTGRAFPWKVLKYG